MNKPNLNAPRFRKMTEGTLNADFIKSLKEKVPSSVDLTNEQIKLIVSKFNENMWKTVIDKRDGVELPEQIGHLFVGTCPPPKKKNIDFKASEEYISTVQHRNFESDQYLAKIFFTTFGSKYRFKNHELWAFDATREFSRTVSATYPENWKKYLQVDPRVKISNIYKSNNYKLDKKEQEQDELKYYDEFDI
jgi:hypothetical protein